MRRSPSLAAVPALSPPPANKLQELRPCLGFPSGTPAQRAELGSPLPSVCCFAWDLREGGAGSFAFFPTCPWVPNFREECESPPLHGLGLVRVSLSPWGTPNVRETVPARKGAECLAAARGGDPGAESWGSRPAAVTQVRSPCAALRPEHVIIPFPTAGHRCSQLAGLAPLAANLRLQPATSEGSCDVCGDHGLPVGEPESWRRQNEEGAEGGPPGGGSGGARGGAESRMCLQMPSSLGGLCVPCFGDLGQFRAAVCGFLW